MTSTTAARNCSTTAYPFPTPPSSEALPETPALANTTSASACASPIDDVRTQLWVQALLRRPRKVYMSARTDLYPLAKTNTTTTEPVFICSYALGISDIRFAVLLPRIIRSCLVLHNRCTPMDSQQVVSRLQTVTPYVHHAAVAI